jgi:DNA-binding MarR family transcriptional regulator/GNAT superfamily N-acetyltransferase
VQPNDIAQLRTFNRELTHRIGAVSDNYLRSGRPLGEARMLFEIGPSGSSERALQRRLGLDAAGVRRMLRALASARLVSTRPDLADARSRFVELTAEGRRAWSQLDRRSAQRATSLLTPLTDSARHRLLAAMAQVQQLLRAASVRIEPASPAGKEAQACLDAYFGELQARFEEGFDPDRTVSAHPGEISPPHGQFLLARLDGEAVGCGALKLDAAGGGELKRMWVSPAARGLGIGQRLLSALEQHARSAGVATLRLDTHRALVEAQRLYLRNGYVPTAPYNDNPYAHHWFEKRLAGGPGEGPATKPEP